MARAAFDDINEKSHILQGKNFEDVSKLLKRKRKKKRDLAVLKRDVIDRQSPEHRFPVLSHIRAGTVVTIRHS